MQSLSQIKQHARRLVILALIMVAIGFVLNIIADNTYTNKIIRTALNDKVSELTNIRIQFTALKVSAVPPGVDLFGFSVQTKDDDKAELLSASHVRAQLSILSLFLGTPRLGLVEATDLDVAYPLPIPPDQILKGTAESAPEENTPVSWPPNFELPIEEIVLRNSSVKLEIEDEESADEPLLLAILRGLDLRVSYSGWDNIAAEIDLSSLFLQASGKRIFADTQVKTSLDLDDVTISSSQLEIEAPAAHVKGSLSGSLKLAYPDRALQSLTLSLNTDVDGDLKMLGDILDIEDTSGPVKGAAKTEIYIPIQGDDKFRFLIDADVESDAAQIAEFKLLQSSGHLQIDSETIKFQDMNIKTTEASFGTANGSLGFDDPMPIDFKIAPEGLPLSQLLQALNVDFDVLDFHMYADEVRLLGTGAPFRMKIQGPGRLESFHFPSLPGERNGDALPKCSFVLDLLTTETQLKFGDTILDCIDPNNLEADTGLAEESKARATAMHLFGTLHYDDKRGADLMLSAPSLDLGMFTPFIGATASGRGSAYLEVVGPYEEVKVNTVLSANEVEISERRLGQVTGSVSIDGKNVIVHKLESQPSESGYFKIIETKIDLENDDILIDVGFEAQDLSGTSMQNVIYANDKETPLVFGVQNAKGRYSGKLDAPLNWLGSADIALSEFSFDKKRFVDEARFTLTANEQEIAITGLSGNLSTIPLLGSARITKKTPSGQAGQASTLQTLGLSPESSLSIELRTDQKISQRSQNEAGRLPYFEDIASQLDIKGQVDFSFKSSGTLFSQQGTGQASLSRLTLFGSQIAPIEVNGFLTADSVDVLFTHGGNALEGRLSLNYADPALPYEYYIHANRFDIRALLTPFFFDDPRNYAYVTADWNMKGSFQDWWNSNGNLKLDSLKMNFVKDSGDRQRSFQLSTTEPISATMSKDMWAIDGDEQFSLEGHMLKVRLGTEGNHPPDRLNLQFRGEIETRILTYLTNSVESATGKVQFIGSLKGSIDAPIFDVQIIDVKPNPYTAATWSPISIGVADLRPAFEDVELDVKIDAKGIQIDQISAKKGGGTVNVFGRYFFTEQANEISRVTANFDNATIVYPVAVLRNFEAVASGSVNLTGQKPPFRLAGDVNIVKARSVGDFNLQKSIVAALQKSSYAANIGPEQPLLNFAINVIADESISITNRNIQSTLSTNLVVQGSDTAPSLSGQIEVDRGKFVYKRDFEINQAIITFDDPVRIDPKLDILAESQVKNYRVTIAITGQVSEPRLDLSIDPPTREDGSPISKLAILSLLSSGTLPSRSSDPVSSRAIARDEAFTLISGTFEETIENFINVTGQDVIRQVYVDAVSDEDGTPTVRANMALNLGDQWDVILRVQQEGELNVTGEYDVDENISVLGTLETRNEKEAETTTDTGVDLKFRFNFP